MQCCGRQVHRYGSCILSLQGAGLPRVRRRFGARPARWRGQRRQIWRTAEEEVPLPEAARGANRGSAIAQTEPPLWRRLTNLTRYGSELGFHAGATHWQPLVDDTIGQILHEEASALGGCDITVQQHGEFRALRLGGCLHSVTIMVPVEGQALPVAAADRVPFGYVRCMAAAAAAFGEVTGSWPGARGPSSTGGTAVCLGVGGGSLPALLAHHYYQTLIQAVDIDPVVLDLAQRFLSLSSPTISGNQNLSVRRGDARSWVASLLAQGVQPEVIFLDCYDSAGRVPADLTGPEFLGPCIEALRPGGLLVANLFNNRPGTEARTRFAAFAVHVQDLVGAGHVYSMKCITQEVNVVLLAVKPVGTSPEPLITRPRIMRAAQKAGKAAGFRFDAAAELEEIFRVHATSSDSFHETKL